LEPFLKFCEYAYIKMRAIHLDGYPWVGQNMGERGTEWDKLYKTSIDPYFAQNYVFLK
jgi:hypothetical protein